MNKEDNINHNSKIKIIEDNNININYANSVYRIKTTKASFINISNSN
jgi:hypothetical protein